MASIFVDANIILGFWSLSDGRVPAELLLPLVELKDHVFITKQIADEISRNKLGVFLKNAGSVAVNLPHIFPDHMVRTRETHAANESLQQLAKDSKAAKLEHDKIKFEIARSISLGTDLTSEMLSPLLKMAVEPSQQDIEAARERREKGNPPGKKTDPLGDQLSWQQFLGALKGEKIVYVITRDADYWEILGKERVLNPLLHNELKSLGVEQIHIFDNLAGAMLALKSANLNAAKDIGAEKLRDLEKEEVEASHPSPPYVAWPDLPWKCPKCGTINERTQLVARSSQYRGGWSYWTSCVKCGSGFDTGEPYDD